VKFHDAHCKPSGKTTAIEAGRRKEQSLSGHVLPSPFDLREYHPGYPTFPSAIVTISGAEDVIENSARAAMAADRWLRSIG
jgi:hypothetical protein